MYSPETVYSFLGTQNIFFGKHEQSQHPYCGQLLQFKYWFKPILRTALLFEILLQNIMNLSIQNEEAIYHNCHQASFQFAEVICLSLNMLSATHEMLFHPFFGNNKYTTELLSNKV